MVQQQSFPQAPEPWAFIREVAKALQEVVTHLDEFSCPTSWGALGSPVFIRAPFCPLGLLPTNVGPQKIHCQN